MATVRPQWLPLRGPAGGQMGTPPNYWGLTLNQFSGIAAYIQTSQEFSQSIMTMWHIVEVFVKPWTIGTGCGVGLLLNESKPLAAQIMISHAWQEFFAEFATTIIQSAHMEGIPRETALWICSFALFQCGNPSGPSIDQQIDLDPFGTVIRSRDIVTFGMRVVLNSSVNVYSRLWCVYEMEQALSEKVNTSGWFPVPSIGNVALLAAVDKANTFVDARHATCKSDLDKKIIVAKVESGSGWHALNSAVEQLSVTFFNKYARAATDPLHGDNANDMNADNPNDMDVCNEFE